MEFSVILARRRSIKTYDSSKTIDRKELQQLFAEVTLSPSAFNLQHWTFVAVMDPDQKKKLREAAWGQPQVEECSVALVVCGKLDAFEDVEQIYQESPAEVQAKVVPMVRDFYQGKEQLQRDEAIRGATLAAMTLMLCATNRGWDTGPMIGFDPEAVSRVIRLTPNFIPVMLVVLGTARGDIRPRAYRRPVAEFVRIDALDGPGLS
jgi:nitroreductase